MSAQAFGYRWHTANPLPGKTVCAGNTVRDDDGAPDGLWSDDGRLWIQTGQAGDAKGDGVNIGGIQQPGEGWEPYPTQNSRWPDNGTNGPTRFTATAVAKPRSAVIVITKDDSGVIGT